MPPINKPTPPQIDHRVVNPSNPSEFLIGLYYSGQQLLAENTEADIVAKNKAAKIYSIACERWLERYIGNHPSVILLKDKVRKLALEEDPVLIVGPTGTGKELIARALHGRRSGKFEAINCTALPSELLESELFGHVKGAFTGAIEDRIGKFQAAFNGTIFLDEIGDMPVDMQAKLLRVLQEKEVTPLGSDKSPIPINCRVVAATNKPVEQLLSVYSFREDLFWRIGTFVLHTLSVYDRLDDFHEVMDSLGGGELMTMFDKEFAGQPEVPVLIPDYQSVFGELKGNVRELQSLVRRYQVLGEVPVGLV